MYPSKVITIPIPAGILTLKTQASNSLSVMQGEHTCTCRLTVMCVITCTNIKTVNYIHNNDNIIMQTHLKFQFT